MQEITTLVFDFGCVLVNLDKQRCIKSFCEIGAENIATYVDECRQEALFHDLEVGNIDVSTFCDEVRRKAPCCKASDEAICEAWNSLLTGIPVRRLRALLQLKDRYRLLLLSNTNPIHWEKSLKDYFTADGKTFDDYFEKAYLSYQMQMLKPDRCIYEALMNDSRTTPEEILFVDDSVANCAAAEQIGITTLHVTNGDEWISKLNIDENNILG